MYKVSNQYHFVFGLSPQVEPFHIAHYLALESCSQVNQPDAIHFYDHYEPYGPWWERIRSHLQLQRVELVDFIARSDRYWQHQEGAYIKQFGLDYAHQSDFLRLQILSEQGGIYADIDTLFVNPLPVSLREQEFVLGREGQKVDPGSGEAYDSLCNAFMLSRPDAPFARRWLAEMYQVFDGTWDRHSCYCASMLAREIPAAIHIVPQRYFYRYGWTKQDISLLLEGRDTDLEGIYSIHLWSHLWWEPARTDFSAFHKNLLTEEFIRTVDTTYNLIARRFLD